MNVIEAASFPIAEIVVGDRLRDVDMDHAAVIASTIETSGLQHHIILRRKGNHIVLVAGAHRLAAYKLLGRDDIPAHLVEAPEGVDTEAYFREMEVVENVARNDLSALDRAVHLGEWLKLAEAKGLKYGKGGDRKSHKVLTDDQKKTFPLIGDLAEQMRVSRRSINQYLALYKDLSPAAIAKLKGGDLADNFTELRKLAAEPADKQLAILQRMDGENPALNIAAAISLEYNEIDISTPDEKTFARLAKLWAGASSKVRKQFKAHIEKTGTKNHV